MTFCNTKNDLFSAYFLSNWRRYNTPLTRMVEPKSKIIGKKCEKNLHNVKQSPMIQSYRKTSGNNTKGNQNVTLSDQ